MIPARNLFSSTALASPGAVTWAHHAVTCSPDDVSAHTDVSEASLEQVIYRDAGRSGSVSLQVLLLTRVGAAHVTHKTQASVVGQASPAVPEALAQRAVKEADVSLRSNGTHDTGCFFWNGRE